MNPMQTVSSTRSEEDRQRDLQDTWLVSRITWLGLLTVAGLWLYGAIHDPSYTPPTILLGVVVMVPLGILAYVASLFILGAAFALLRSLEKSVPWMH